MNSLIKNGILLIVEKDVKLLILKFKEEKNLLNILIKNLIFLLIQILIMMYIIIFISIIIIILF